MARVSTRTEPDDRQIRATPVRARAHASRESLVQAAIALWRTNGFEATTVTDICKAAGVSKSLFYVYFARKEDVLAEAEVFAMRDAHLAAKGVAKGPYQLLDLIASVIDPLVRRMRRFPPDLIFECVMESYRLERRALVDGAGEADLGFLFLEPFEQAHRDNKLPTALGPVRAARIAQSLVSDGIRRWAASGFADRAIVDTLAREVTEVLSGHSADPPQSATR